MRTTRLIILVYAMLGLFAALVLTGFMATAASAAAWNRTSSNGLGSGDSLNDVAIVPGTHDAYAVGSEVSPAMAGEVEFWDGSAWAATAVGTGELDGVAAASASDVWAVGSTDSQQAWHFDGAKWTNVPVPADDRLRDVVVTSNGVWAVGWKTNPAGVQAVILQWDGTSWSTSTPIPATRYDSRLLGITDVPGSRQLWAVGFTSGNQIQPLAVRFNGSSWHRVALPAISTATIQAVAASSASEVFAVGSVFETQPLILRWDGSAWTSVPVSFPQQFTDIAHVPRTNHFWAVGYLSAEASPVTDLVARFNGLRWRSVTIPDENCDEPLGVAAIDSHVFAVGQSGVQSGTTFCAVGPSSRDLVLRRR